MCSATTWRGRGGGVDDNGAEKSILEAKGVATNRPHTREDAASVDASKALSEAERGALLKWRGQPEAGAGTAVLGRLNPTWHEVSNRDLGAPLNPGPQTLNPKP